MDKDALASFPSPAWLSSQARYLPQSMLLEGSSDGLMAAWSDALVAVWLCQEQVDLYCGHCPSCRCLQAGYHPDYFDLVALGKTLGIERIREAVDFLSLAPQMSTVRVVRIVAAEQMSVAAANALLKILEEPPEHSRILLLSAIPSRLLPTIRSRCMRLPNSPLQEQVVRDYLQAHGVLPEDVSALLEGFGDRIDAALAAVHSGTWQELQSCREMLLTEDLPSQKIWQLLQDWGKEDERIWLLRLLFLSLYREIFRIALGINEKNPKPMLQRKAQSQSLEILWQEYAAWLALARDLRQNLQGLMRLESLLWVWFTRE